MLGVVGEGGFESDRVGDDESEGGVEEISKVGNVEAGMR